MKLIANYDFENIRDEIIISKGKVDEATFVNESTIYVIDNKGNEYYTTLPDYLFDEVK